MCMSSPVPVIEISPKNHSSTTEVDTSAVIVITCVSPSSSEKFSGDTVRSKLPSSEAATSHVPSVVASTVRVHSHSRTHLLLAADARFSVVGSPARAGLAAS